MTFQAQKPQPMVYIRTLLQSFLFKDMVILGRLSIRRILDDDLCLIVLPSSRHLDPTNDLVEAPHHPHFAIAHQMELFRQRAAQSYLDIFRAFCQNRCRIRRTLLHSIQDWEMVQMDAEEIDGLLQHQIEEKPLVIHEDIPDAQPSYYIPLASWAYLYKLRLMEWRVQIGFELEIYAADELAGMYWYLSSLARSRVRLIERIKFFINHRYADYQANRPNNLSISTNNSETQFARTKTWLRQAGHEAAATAEFADALSHLYTILLREKLIVPPPRPYGSPELRHQVRMKGLDTIGLPEFPSAEEFQAGAEQAHISSPKLLDKAIAALARVKRRFTELGEMGQEKVFTFNCHDRWKEGNRNVVKSVIAANILISTLKERIEDEEKGTRGMKIGIENPAERYHDWWTLPVFASKGEE